MTNASPKVSILIPTYNQQNFIGACIGSALAQSYGNLEVIVSDDASTDATGDIARQLTSDPRLRYERNPDNLGHIGNYRRLLNDLATGEWFLMLDGDDLLINPHYIARAVELAQSQVDIVLVFGKQLIGADVTNASVNNDALGLPAVMDGSTFFLEHPPFLGVEPKALTSLVRRTAAVDIDFYRYNILSSDFESYYRLMVGHRIAFLDEIAGLWRQHKGNLSKGRSFEIYRDNFRAIVGPYEHAGSQGIFSTAELQSWLRRSAGRYTLFCLRRLLTVGRVWDAAKLIAFLSRVDAGIIGHALARMVRRTQRGLNDRLGRSGEDGANEQPR
jgi:glycosyltransferase involved in cell wall biosynthesis